MYDLGVKLSAGLIPRLVGKNRTERIAEIVEIMNETGFIAKTIAAEGIDKLPRVECKKNIPARGRRVPALRRREYRDADAEDLGRDAGR